MSSHGVTGRDNVSGSKVVKAAEDVATVRNAVSSVLFSARSRSLFSSPAKKHLQNHRGAKEAAVWHSSALTSCSGYKMGPSRP